MAVTNAPPPTGLLDAAATAARKALAFLVDAARHGFAEIRNDRADQIAAALTFFTLFSLLPTMALVLVVLRTFVGPAEQEAFKEFVVQGATDWLVVPAAGPDGALLNAPPPDSAEFAFTIARIDETVAGMLDRLQNINFQSIGVVGVFVFIWASTGLLATIEQSFNIIYGAPQSRPWHVRLPLYYTTLTLAPLLIIAGQVLQARFVAEVSGVPWVAWLGPPLGVVAPVMTTWVVFYLMYALIPNTHVNLRAAGIGALFAAVGWVSLLELFGLYVGVYAGKSLYGALAVVPLGLMWLWLNWLIVLFGLEVSYALQTVPRRGDLVPVKRELDARALCDPRWLVAILAAVAERFSAGESTPADEIAQRLRAPETTVRALTEHLADKGFLHRVKTTDDEGPASYTLARPPETIALNDLYDLWNGFAHEGGAADTIPGEEVVARLEEARRAAFASITLRGAALSRGV